MGSGLRFSGRHKSCDSVLWELRAQCPEGGYGYECLVMQFEDFNCF